MENAETAQASQGGRLSQNGQWIWNGAQWVPNNQWRWNGAQWVPATQQPQARNRSIFWPVLGALIVFAVIAVIVFATYSSERAEQQRKDEWEQGLCERYGGNFCD